MPDINNTYRQHAGYAHTIIKLSPSISHSHIALSTFPNNIISVIETPCPNILTMWTCCECDASHQDLTKIFCRKCGHERRNQCTFGYVEAPRDNVCFVFILNQILLRHLCTGSEYEAVPHRPLPIPVRCLEGMTCGHR
jgi:hypothetical protein